MLLESLVARYGLVAVFAGTFLEGETVLVLAAFASHSGYLDLGDVLLAAFLGTLLGDQLWFWIGRRGGQRFAAEHPRWGRRVEAARPWIMRHEGAVMWGYRFLYGFRSITPFVLGTGGTSPLRFAAVNAGSAALWVLIVGGLGYLLGTLLERLLGDLRAIEGALFAAILGLGALAWLWHAWQVWRLGRGRR